MAALKKLLHVLNVLTFSAFSTDAASNSEARPDPPAVATNDDTNYDMPGCFAGLFKRKVAKKLITATLESPKSGELKLLSRQTSTIQGRNSDFTIPAAACQQCVQDGTAYPQNPVTQHRVSSSTSGDSLASSQATSVAGAPAARSSCDRQSLSIGTSTPSIPLQPAPCGSTLAGVSPPSTPQPPASSSQDRDLPLELANNVPIDSDSVIAWAKRFASAAVPITWTKHVPTNSELQQAAAHLRQHSDMAPDAVTRLEKAGDVLAKMWMEQQAQLHAVRVVSAVGRNALRQQVADMVGQNLTHQATIKELQADIAQLYAEKAQLWSSCSLLMADYQHQCAETTNLRAMVLYYQSTMSTLLLNCVMNYDCESVTLNPAGTQLLVQAVTQPMAQPTPGSMVAADVQT